MVPLSVVVPVLVMVSPPAVPEPLKSAMAPLMVVFPVPAIVSTRPTLPFSER